MAEFRYLLDTNIVSDLVRNPSGIVTTRIADVGEKRVCTSIIVTAELRYGAQKKGSERLSRQLETVLSGLAALPFEAPSNRHYGTLRADLQRNGRLIGPNDLLIAAHTLALGLILVTTNTSEFERVPGLAVENWLV